MLNVINHKQNLSEFKYDSLINVAQLTNKTICFICVQDNKICTSLESFA